MVNVQRFLLSLLPAISNQPAPVFLIPAFTAAVSDDGGIDNFLHAIEVAEEAWFCFEVAEPKRPCTT